MVSLEGIPRFLRGDNGGVALRVTDFLGVIFRRCLLPTGSEPGGKRTQVETILGSEPLRVEIQEPDPEHEPRLVARYLFCWAGAC